MHRFRGAVVIGALAAVVSVVAAGAALAATGGNSDNAHACQQGGHENLFEAETGRRFKNAGDCASHGAQGGVTSSLQVTTDLYPCTPPIPFTSCWGSVSGSGLRPGADVVLQITDPPQQRQVIGVADATGSVSQKLDLDCRDVFGAFVFSVTSEGALIESATASTPC
jgi:hypothetical protein